MKKLYTLALWLPATTLAQPIITASVAPRPGDQCSYLYCSSAGPLIGPGPDQYWDLTGLPFTPSYTQLYVDPQDTPAALFSPGASVAYVNATETYYEYYTISPAAWTVNGLYFVGSGVIYSAIDPMEVMHFPWSYGTVHEDANLYEANDGSDTLQDTLRWSADAYGTVRLPGGTELPVVGIMQTTYDTDTTEVGIYSYENTELWLYTPDVRCRLATLYMEVAYLDGSVWNVSSRVRALDDATIGMAEAAPASNEPMVWPVPAQGKINVRCTVHNGAHTELRVIDATGRIVLTERSTTAELSNGTTIDVSSLAPGTYVLSVIDAGATTTATRFVVE